MSITRVELQSGFYAVVVMNDPEEKKTEMQVADWALCFSSKQKVIDHIAVLNKALELWEFDDPAPPTEEPQT